MKLETKKEYTDVKVPVINDLHFGYSNAKKVFAEELQKFFYHDFWPYCEANDVKYILNLGDLLDDRKNANIRTLNLMERIFLSELEERDITQFLIPGNHDVFYKNTNVLNALVPLLKRHSNTILIDEPRTISFDKENGEKIKILMVPWINRENEAEIMAAIHESDADYCCTHAEFIGTLVTKSHRLSDAPTPNAVRLDVDLFKKFKMVFNGHIHIRSQPLNILHLGTQYQMNWNDYGQEKGFHVFDTETEEVEFIGRSSFLFTKCEYIDDQVNGVPALRWLADMKDYMNEKFVRVYVKSVGDKVVLRKFMEELNRLNCHDVKLVDQTISEDEFHQNFDEISHVSTLEFMYGYVDDLGIEDSERQALKSILADLHQDAMAKA